MCCMYRLFRSPKEDRAIACHMKITRTRNGRGHFACIVPLSDIGSAHITRTFVVNFSYNTTTALANIDRARHTTNNVYHTSTARDRAFAPPWRSYMLITTRRQHNDIEVAKWPRSSHVRDIRVCCHVAMPNDSRYTTRLVRSSSVNQTPSYRTSTAPRYVNDMTHVLFPHTKHRP